MKNLPKGLRLDKGYLQIRLFSDGKTYCQNFGRDSEFARETAVIMLNELRKKLLMWKAGIVKEHPFNKEVVILSKKFKEVAELYFQLWSEEKDAEGRLKHTGASLKYCRGVIDRSLIPFFGKMIFSDIKPVNVQEWRDKRMTSVLGTSANREQVVLSSIFSHIEQWVKTEKIKSFAIPLENPCSHIEKAPNRRRERVLSTQELNLLKQSCVQLNDPDLWELCKMALKSLLRSKDLMRLENGQTIDLEQAKTGVRVMLPIQVLKPLNYINFRKRWEAVRKASTLLDVQFRDLRKTGANLLKMKNHSNKLISEFLGHTNTETTEIYLVKNSAHLKPLADDLSQIVDSL